MSAQLVLPKKINGYVDMHAHPVSQWGFGEQLFFGENDGDPKTALGSCNCYHNFVAPPFDGFCGAQNMYRNSMVDKVDKDNHIAVHKKVAGFPNFEEWPKHNSLLHQQMYVDWIKRAKEGGLRVMVSLAMSNNCLGDAAETSGPIDDMRSMNKQIEKMKAFFGRHKDFMEIAYTSNQLWDIVSSGRLAIVLGIEMDNIGNFYMPADTKGYPVFFPAPTEAQVKAEIDRIYALGVRYIFPVHVTNNVFGGTALYNPGFNVANKYNTGKVWEPEAVSSTNGITFKLTSAFSEIRQDFLALIAMTATGTILPKKIMPDIQANYPAYSDPGLNKGHRNSLGLTPLGEYAMKYMMRKGMIIDIDHMSEKGVDRALEIANEKNYPLNSGHNDFRSQGSYHENARTDEQVKLIYKTGGMMGLGHGDHSTKFVKNLRYGLNLSGGQPLAIGTDANGFYALPEKPTAKERIEYKPPMTKALMGQKFWDFNTDGMAHYGLLPDYIQSCRNAGMTKEEEDAFFGAANRFANMWDKCESRAADFNNIDAGGEEKTFNIPAEDKLCPTLASGDREFGGNGPDVTCTVTLKIVQGGVGIDAVIKMTANETKGGDTKAAGTWTRRVYTAPGGTRVKKINSDTEGKAHFVSHGAGAEFGVCNEGLVYDSGKGQITITGTVIKSIIMVGDTGGPDVTANSSNCGCDTNIKKLVFNPVTVMIIPL
ncbi:MAG TPA: membrane dipeptidase [Chitinophagaceae bacterium]|nr:membrane dipeptidase [Chitinophagaceae bacterium]